jgi:flagellar basal body rod protein FlgG
MSTTLELLAAAMRSNADALTLVAQNVANAQSVAYLRQIPVAHAAYADVASQLGGSGNLRAAESAGALDLRPGTLRSTANPLHVALQSTGFFVVETAHGTLLTRRGDFRLDASGQLVTQAGDTVQGASGPLNLAAGTPVIAPDGTIRVNGDVAGKLRIVNVGDASDLRPVGDGLYQVAAGGEPADAAAPVVHQGFLETSNVQPVNEMLTLLEAMRRFEAAQRFVRGYDEMTESTLSTLGRI